MQNHVGLATHQSQYTIDLVITRETLSCIAEIRKGFTLLDNAFITVVLMVEKCNKTKTKECFMKKKSIALEEFKCDQVPLRANNFSVTFGCFSRKFLYLFDLAEFAKTFISLNEPLDHLVHEYNTTLTDILNKHTPLKTKTVKIRHRQPCFNDHIRCEIILRCRKECDWNDDPTAHSRNAFYQQRCIVSNLMDSAKQNYYLDYIKEQCSDI